MRFRSTWIPVLCLVMVAIALGCQRSAKDQLSEARQSLAASAFGDAIASAQEGLAKQPDDVTTWGLEVVVLEAQARKGDADAAQAQLERLATSYPGRIAASDYSSTAALLKAADEKPGAIVILDLGVKRFPGDPVLAKMIEESVATGNDPAELEMLRSLGYIE